MFSLQRKVSADGIFTSQLFDETSFYGKFMRDLKRAQKYIVIESPYLTVTRAEQFAPLIYKLRRRGIKVYVYTRLPRHHSPRLREQPEIAIEVLNDAGAAVYVCGDMRHRKLAVIDGRIMYEGSLNILSQSRSKEVMRRTDSPELCQQMLRFTGLYQWRW